MSWIRNTAANGAALTGKLDPDSNRPQNDADADLQHCQWHGIEWKVGSGSEKASK
jgi:hypothetical protein